MNRTDRDPSGVRAALDRALFGEGDRAYAVLDSARRLDLLDRLEEMAPPHECLFPAHRDRSVEMVAPYLVELRPDEPFRDWLFEAGWGGSWGVWVASRREMHEMRAHFRRLIVAEMPDGHIGYFRFYDPRVMRAFLPTCDDRQRAAVYGEAVDLYLMEDADGGLLALAR